MKDKIGIAITKWLMPYITQDYKKRGDTMKDNMDYEKYCLTEKYLWFLGKEDLLSDFYNTQFSNFVTYDPRNAYYYRQSASDVRKIHSGMPSLISYSKVRLLNNGNIISKILLKNGNEDKAKTIILNDMLVDNTANDLIKKSILTESWGGKFSWKISYDKSVSDFPILTMYNPLEYKAVYKYGRLQALIFINKIDKGKDHYELEEEYGKGYIDYYLYKVKEDGTRTPLELSYLEETMELARVEFKDKKLILAGEKVNDKSDYDGIISEFDALDEAWSQLMDEIRLGRSEVYVPEVLLTNKTFDRFRKNFPVLAPDMKENGQNHIEHIQPNIRSGEYKNTIGILTNNILVNVGLSPFTVGIDDTVGANASGDSMTKREATSLRTREDMVKSWEAFLTEMFTKLLVANDLFNKKALQTYNLSVMFEDYITPSKDEVVKQTTELVNANIIDTEKALDEIYGDTLTEEEKLRILANTGNVSMQEETQEEDIDTEDTDETEE